MKIAGGRIAAALIPLMLGSLAQAQTSVRCDLAPTTALGTAVVNANPGAILAITGLCQQQVTIASVLQWGITITNESGDPQSALNVNDGVKGQLQIVGPLQVAINGITLEGPASDLALPSVLSVLGGRATIANAQIVNGWRDGLIVGSTGNVVITNTAISGHGAANIAGQTDGIRVSQGSTVALGDEASDGAINTADAVTVENNVGNGITALGNSTVVVAGGTVQGNAASQIFLAGGSAAVLYGTHVTQQAASPFPGNFAIQALQSSKLLLMQGASVQGGTVAGGVFASSSSSLALIGSSVANNVKVSPAIEATGNSNVVLSGGNTVSNSAANGFAIQIDHSSSLLQAAGSSLSAEFAGVPVLSTPAADTITGVGLIQEQSSMELGVGIIGGGNGLVWTGSIVAAQNSSLRMSGGTSISGSVSLTQGSNGFFNIGNGGTNSVVGGVTCPWSAAPSSHLAGPQNVSPTPSLAASFASATKNQCLPF